jgi:hypothetical protein
VIEQGIVMLVQQDPGVLTICSSGGFMSTLPKGFALPSWTYLTVGNTSEDDGLTTISTLNRRMLQIDVYGDPAAQGADVLALAQVIDDVLGGYAGVLPDPDQTLCQGCFQSNMQDFFDDANRGYRRMLEYEIWYSRSAPIKPPKTMDDVRSMDTILDMDTLQES